MKRNAPVSDEEALRLVIEGTASETGTAFFRSLVKNLCEALGTMAAWVTEYLAEEQVLRAHAMWLEDHFVDHYEYGLQSTPCQPVIEERKLVHIPSQVIDLFPRDSDLRDANAVSYLGTPIVDTDGSVLGHLGVLDDKEMPSDPKAIALFEIFAARAAGEMRRLKAQEALAAREQQLSRLLESAMDGIVVVDARFHIIRINPAAERLFGCTAEDLLGENLKDFLVEDSGAALDILARSMESQPDGKQQLWVPQDFVARRWDHSVFPAEGTVSRFQTPEGVFFTMILRNADERLAAERKIRLLTQETEFLREMAGESAASGQLLGRSDCMQAVMGAVRKVAPTDSTVLITGETGTGKELVARSLHQSGKRSDKPLVLVNCAAIPANLIESEFFGHEKGAFTGAVSRREGRFKLADGGTIFLDEVGELPLELQAKLLRVLQEGEFEPLGSSKTQKVNVRVIAATNRNLKKMAAAGDFREDLFFRLNVFPIAIPPLRERGRDIEQLAEVFASRFSRRMGKHLQPLQEAQFQLLRGYNWPGNVRELQNVIERAVILTDGPVIALERAMTGIAGDAPGDSSSAPRTGDGPILTASQFEEMEKDNILRAMEACAWTVSGEAGAARLLGIPPTTLSSRLKSMGIRKPGS